MDLIQKEYDYIGFGCRLKTAREKAGLTQSQACKAVGIPKAQVLSSYERGISNPPIDSLAALAQLYGVSLDDLILGEKKPKLRFTTGDWLFSLVCAVDSLAFVPESSANTSHYNLQYDATGVLLWGENSVYKDFFEKWKKLRDAWLDHLIDYTDYYHLVRRHANQVPDDPKGENICKRIKELDDLRYTKEPSFVPSPIRNAVSKALSLISE